ncbi:hypothetical protein SH580_19115 [Coraliomargarita algicola]|uniref:Uncharacterized protein n=1 Tax=Coraliomargarita algicola TaxID=3092156 RepID=A0ABZ0RHA0_9BACT|nr:hypothetical protein [Coraliomargarita sp. J2-16]WPJ95531.1 hypothetical protein SH580_19115 [Coraliomargarita sp. J2-16]
MAIRTTIRNLSLIRSKTSTLATIALAISLGIAPLKAQQDTLAVDCDIFLLPCRQMLKSHYDEEAETFYQIRSSFPELYPSPPQSSEPIQLKTDHISQGIQYKGPADFACYEQGPINANGEASWLPRVKFTLPQESTQMLVLIDSESTEQESIWRTQALDISPHQVPTGSLLIFNNSEEPLIMKQANGKPQPLRPKESILISTRDLDSYRLKISFAGWIDDQWKLIINRRMLIDPKQRIICPIYYDENAKAWKANQYLLPPTS